MENKYSEDYKHFDNLIWQLPVWSTAIFILAVTGVAYISTSDFSKIAPTLDKYIYSSVISFVCFFFQLSIFNALVRFRDHQRNLAGNNEEIFAKWCFSGQTWLQFAVIGQTCALFFFAVNVSGLFAPEWPTIILGLILSFYSIHSVYFQKKQK